MVRPRYAYTLPPHRVEWGVLLPVADLRIDPAVQRNINKTNVKRIADTLVESAMGEITVNQRADGHYYVCNGMHRLSAAALNGITHVRCEVHYGLSRKDEATLFMITNRESATPSPIDQYKVALEAGIDSYVDADKVLAAHGLTMGNTSANGVGAVNGVIRIVETYDMNVLERVISVAEEAWDHTPATWDGMVLGGLGKFIGSHPTVKDAELAAKLKRWGTAESLKGKIHHVSTGGASRASGTSGRITASYSIIKEIWNSRRQPANRIA